MEEAMAWSPLVNGLHLGQVVEILGTTSSQQDYNGELGQLMDYLPEADKFVVSIVSTGEVVQVVTDNVATVVGCGGPGEGGDEDSFDIVIGPMTGRGPLSETLTTCLANKGFCVARVIQEMEEVTKSFDGLKELDGTGTLARLAQEVEEGYLGRSGRAKVMWVDPSKTSKLGSLVLRSDANLTAIAEVLQGSSEDSAGGSIAERTPALLCLSMTDADEAEYECPAATDQEIEEFYSTWSRSVMRVIQFIGPGKGKAILTLKESAPANSLEESSFEITAAPGTLLVIREDMYEYMYEEPDDGETCWLTTFFMKEGVQWTMEDLEGDMKVLGSVGSGPPPPDDSANNLVAVCAISIQACGKMTTHEKEWVAYLAGCDGQLEMPFDRFDYIPYYDEEMDFPQGTTFTKHFSVQDGIELFDNRTFEISNAEAEGMDPQCRQVLEVGYLSCFHIGVTKKYSNTNPLHASVSVGCDKQEWLTMPYEVPRAVSTNQLAIVSNRFNYVFNLKGGSFSVDTACSSSLIGAHLGKMNFLEKRWDPIEWHLGLGAGLTLSVGSFIGSCAQHMLSPGGRCFTFNATANGYNRGDGTACMLIKQGVCEEHRICYFRGSQIGQDGRSASMAAPNGPAQEKCVWGAIREARMTPPESTVWENHGTGTSLGDPIEVGAVRKVQIKMKRLEPLMVASSKSNFGHLEGSAAALGMNKCIMTVIKTNCAPTIHLKTLNPHLDHSKFEAIFVTETNPYKYQQGHAQVSSFGVGGTNGHAIFWGEGYKPPPDFKRQFAEKMKKAGSPIVAAGRDPSTWEHKGLGLDSKPDDVYKVTYLVDDNGMTSVQYEKQTVYVYTPEFYSTTGNHNGWGEDRMIEGDVAGLFYQELEVPESGKLEFRILADGEGDQVIGPEATTSRRTEPIVGPQKDLKTSWVVEAPEGSSVRLEYFAASSMRSITWFLIRDE
jgi:polyketide synthase-associated protein